MNKNNKDFILNVLLVEDNKDDSIIFQRVIKESRIPFKITEFSRAEDALKKLQVQESLFSIVVTDHSLPGMSGLDLCKKLIAKATSLPLVLLTGLGSEQIAIEALKSGIDEYIIKDTSKGYLSLLPYTLEGVVKKHREKLLRIKAEEARHESEEKFKSAFESAAIGMALISLDGRFLKINQPLCDITGYTIEELTKKTIRDITHPDDFERGAEYVKKVFTGEIRSSRMEKRYIHKSGQNIWVSLSVSAVRDKNGVVIYGINQVLDITERKKSEEERKKLIHKLQNALANVKKLSGLLPICSSCKKIRDDRGYWNQIESFIKSHSEADFTHGICPECEKNLYSTEF